MHTGGAQNLAFRLTISTVCVALPVRGEDILAHSPGEAMSLLRCDFNLLHNPRSGSESQGQQACLSLTRSASH